MARCAGGREEEIKIIFLENGSKSSKRRLSTTQARPNAIPSINKKIHPSEMKSQKIDINPMEMRGYVPGWLFGPKSSSRMTTARLEEKGACGICCTNRLLPRVYYYLVGLKSAWSHCIPTEATKELQQGLSPSPLVIDEGKPSLKDAKSTKIER